jgi:L-ascorbate metabolism protein UlaG (beta-lactamase superfamily)
VADVRITHIGGPTTLIEVDGLRLLTDPTFDAPGRRYSSGWGSASRKTAGPAVAVAELPPIDAVLLSHDHHGDVVGFALAWPGQPHGVLWISGDTVLHDGVRQVAERLTVDTAVLHLGAVRFGITGPVRYTMTAREAVDLCRLLRPRTVLPVHHEGWGHFREGRQAIDHAFAAAPDDIGSTLRWLPLGGAVTL